MGTWQFALTFLTFTIATFSMACGGKGESQSMTDENSGTSTKKEDKEIKPPPAGDTNPCLVTNSSSIELGGLKLKKEGGKDWGMDYLANNSLMNGEIFQISDVACGKYEAEVADSLGQTCKVNLGDICADPETKAITITDELLANCQFGN